jgi:hypothetical protein
MSTMAFDILMGAARPQSQFISVRTMLLMQRWMLLMLDC